MVTRLRGQKSGPENKFHARKPYKIPYVAEPIFFEKIVIIIFTFFIFLSAHTLATGDLNSFRRRPRRRKKNISFHSILFCTVIRVERSNTRRRKNQYYYDYNVLRSVIRCPIIFGAGRKVIHSYNSSQRL